jgi:hypothetical protein
VLPFWGLPFFHRPSRRVLVKLNPRYDPQEAWHWLYLMIESEAQSIELGEQWEAAIQTACEPENEDDTYYE